jgi:hypothetical protein
MRGEVLWVAVEGVLLSMLDLVLVLQGRGAKELLRREGTKQPSLNQRRASKGKGGGPQPPQQQREEEGRCDQAALLGQIHTTLFLSRSQ